MNPAKNVFDYPFFIEQKSVILKCIFDVRACLKKAFCKMCVTICGNDFSNRL